MAANTLAGPTRNDAARAAPLACLSTAPDAVALGTAPEAVGTAVREAAVDVGMETAEGAMETVVAGPTGAASDVTGGECQ